MVKLGHLCSVSVVDAVDDPWKDGRVLRPAVPPCVPQQLVLLDGDAVQRVAPADLLQLLVELVQGLAPRSRNLDNCVGSGVRRVLHSTAGDETHLQ